MQEPSRALAKRMLGEVGFDDHLVGFRLRERCGPIVMKLYSSEEVLALLQDPHPRIDFVMLRDWMGRCMGDEALARGIGEVLTETLTEQQRSFKIRDLLAERLLQCRRVVGHR